MSAKKGWAAAEIKNMNIRREEKKSIARVTTWMAGFVAGTIMIILPLGYYLIAYQYIAGSLETEAEINARLISQVITANPELWRYESLRLQDLLNRRPRAGYPENRRIFDMNKELIAESVNPLRRPVMSRSHQLMDAGIPVATIEISCSLYPLLVQTGLVGLVAMAIAFITFVPLRLIPLRAVDRAQQALRRYAQELKESNEEMQAFMFTAAHDLRAPIVNIGGFTSELRQAMEKFTALVQKAMAHLDEDDRIRLRALDNDIPLILGFINASTDRINALNNAMLKLSRFNTQKLKARSLNVGEIVRTVSKTMAESNERKDVAVTIGPLPEVVADQFFMEQIMGNLLDNALKYLEPGREGAITITADKGVHEVTFHVRDNGRGIAVEDIPKVFDLFRRMGKQDVPGEGMGLAYAKTLVRRLGGRIWCESEPGKGSVFSFTIPIGTPLRD
jgi:signal transduction histidine kinase